MHNPDADLKFFALLRLYPNIAKLMYTKGHTMLNMYPGGVKDDLFSSIYQGFITDLLLKPIYIPISWNDTTQAMSL